jgi:hypothetical protein
MTIETLDENVAREEFSKAVRQYGFGRCKVEKIEAENASPIFRITVTK